jgi:hypothetical protein
MPEFVSVTKSVDVAYGVQHDKGQDKAGALYHRLRMGTTCGLWAKSTLPATINLPVSEFLLISWIPHPGYPFPAGKLFHFKPADNEVLG